MKLCSVSFIFGLLALQLLLLSTIVNAQEARDSCNSTLPLNDLTFNSSLLQCVDAWSVQNYILRYARTEENTWNFILSTPESRAYIGIGFSTNGQMVGSSAIVGWIPSDGGSGETKQYSLGGKTSSEVTPDQGELMIVNGSLKIESVSSRLYMSFQLTAELPRQSLLYALGPEGVFPASPEFRLRQHRFATSTTINYNTGGGPTTFGPTMSPGPAKTETASPPPSPPSKPSHAPSSAYGLSRCLLFFGIILVALTFY